MCGVKWVEFNSKDQMVTKVKWFKTEEARKKFVAKLVEKDNFCQIYGYTQDC